MAKFKVFKIAELMGRLSQVADINRFDQVARNVHQVFANKQKGNPNALVTSDEIAQTYSTFANMDNQSDFRDHFEDVFKEETATAESNEDIFGRDNSFSEDFRPTAIEYEPNAEDEIKAASLLEIQKTVEGSVDNPQYHYNGYGKVANLGGFANWNVSFNTGRGNAVINVPVAIVDSAAHAPAQFSTASGSKKFTKAELVNYAKSYEPTAGEQITANSGLESWASDLATIPTEQFHSDVDTAEVGEVALGEATPIDESMTANVDEAENAIAASIMGARDFAMKKVAKDEEGNKVPTSVQLDYVGTVQDEEALNDKNNFNGTIAFNMTRKNVFGSRTITIPVKVSGKTHIAETFVDKDNAEHTLNATAIEDFFGSDEGLEVHDYEEEAFTDAFLSTEASYKELLDEMKANIEVGNMSRANASIKAISSRFNEDTLKSAMAHYLHFVHKAKGLDTPTKVASLVEDNQYDGVLKSSSIVMN